MTSSLENVPNSGNKRALDSGENHEASKRRKHEMGVTFVADAGFGGSRSSGRSKSSNSKGGNRRDKGLRHFSMKVCEKMQLRGEANYTDIADDLVSELAEGGEQLSVSDEKNIRRRVYDALNVLLAINAVEKTNVKRTVAWKGIEVSIPPKIRNLIEDRDKKRLILEQKKNLLADMLAQVVSRVNLISRNSRVTQTPNARIPSFDGNPGAKMAFSSSCATPPNRRSSASVSEFEDEKIYVPFVLMMIPRDETIDCQMDEDVHQVDLFCSCPFTLHEHSDVVRCLGFDRVSQWDLARIIPPDFCPYYPSNLIQENARIGNRNMYEYERVALP